MAKRRWGCRDDRWMTVVVAGEAMGIKIRLAGWNDIVRLDRAFQRKRVHWIGKQYHWKRSVPIVEKKIALSQLTINPFPGSRGRYPRRK
jgi:hypothetical protein